MTERAGSMVNGLWLAHFKKKSVCEYDVDPRKTWETWSMVEMTALNSLCSLSNKASTMSVVTLEKIDT